MIRLLSAFLIFSMPVAASADDWPALVRQVSISVPAGNHAELEILRNELTRELTTTLGPREEVLRRYTLAYVSRSLAFNPKNDAARRKVLIGEALEELTRAVELDPRNAEAFALLGSTSGLAISYFPEKTIDLSNQSRAALGKALDLEPFNPRVHYLNGSSAYHRPPEYGGGTKPAEEFLRKALELFRNEPKEKPWPNWGRYETHVLLGQTLEKLQRRDDALDQYRAALALVPESDLVKRVLIPRVTRKPV